jgi:anti-sigma factor RsiW
MKPLCIEMREHMTELSRGTLPAETRRELEEHVETCAECAAALERELATEALLGRLPRREATAEFKERLRARVAEAAAKPSVPPPRIKPRSGAMLGLLAALIAVLGAVALFVRLGPQSPQHPLVVEAVNDHLRMLYAQNPLEVAVSDQHQVKPWFSGRVDFAPVLRFGGDDRFELAGGAVALFVDRKAAMFVFKRRLHRITLLNFRSESLPWPHEWNTRIGGLPALVTSRDGFHVILWQADELGCVSSRSSRPDTPPLLCADTRSSRNRSPTSFVGTGETDKEI